MRKLWLGLGALGCTAALSSPANALNELNTYGISNFGGVNQCGKMSDSHTVHQVTALAFSLIFNALKGAGQWDTSNLFPNTSANASHFSDSGKVASGADLSIPKGTDTADILYAHTHGGHNATGSNLMMSNNSQGCFPSTDGNMRFGNAGGDLDLAVIKACQSGDFDLWQADRYRSQLTTTTGSLSMWNAFHGDSSCGNHVTSYMLLYSMMSIKDGVGENWIDAAYDDDGGLDTDDCPVSMVFGSSFANRNSLYENGGWRDRKNTGNKTGSTIWFIGGCDPDSGSVLPNG